MTKAHIFQPDKVLTTLGDNDLVVEKHIKVTDNLKQYEQDYTFFFVNTMHMYLRIPISLFKLYTREFNRKITVTNFELPQSILTENIEFHKDMVPPAPGWSRYVQGMSVADYTAFSNWLTSTKWMSHDTDNRRILFECCRETAHIRDPVKLQTFQAVGIKEFVDIDFFLPASLGSRLYLNTKNGPPFTCVYVTRSSPGNGDLTEIFNKIKSE